MSDRRAERAPAAADVELLRTRAAVLARVPRVERERERLEAITFDLGDEHFALAAACVLEVAVLREFTPLPGAREPLFGITHWRGTLLTLLDLRTVLGVRVRGLTDLGRVIVLEGSDRDFGFLADRVHGMMDIDLAALGPVGSAEAERSSLLRGITAEATLVLDEDALLERYGAATRHVHNTG